VKLNSQKYKLEDVDSLVVHPENPRTGDTRKIRESIKANGFYGVLVVQKSTRCVLAGNHRLIAAREMGAKKLPVIWVECSDDEALRIMLADNRTSDLATYDNAKLAELLEYVQQDVGTLIGTGYTLAELSALAGDVDQDVDPEAMWTGMPEFQQDDLTAHRTITVSFASDEDVEEFAKRLELKTVSAKTNKVWFPWRERMYLTDKVMK